MVGKVEFDAKEVLRIASENRDGLLGKYFEWDDSAAAKKALERGACGKES